MNAGIVHARKLGISDFYKPLGVVHSIPIASKVEVGTRLGVQYL